MTANNLTIGLKDELLTQINNSFRLYRTFKGQPTLMKNNSLQFVLPVKHSENQSSWFYKCAFCLTSVIENLGD